MLRNNQGLRLVLFFVVIFFSSFHALAADLPENRYVIGPGDVLDISVWKNDALTQSVPVLPDGYISFPLVGEVKAAGKTLSELKKALEGKLIRFIPQPSLSVIVQKVNLNIYIVGKVNSPGMYSLSENIDVLQALTMAKGLNVFADRNKIKILRKIDNETRIFEFVYDDVSAGHNLEQNIDMARGDVIVVP